HDEGPGGCAHEARADRPVQEAEERGSGETVAVVREGVAVMGAPGFDDAPFADIRLDGPKPITMVYPYYENPRFLSYQIQNWRGSTETLQIGRASCRGRV